MAQGAAGLEADRGHWAQLDGHSVRIEAATSASQAGVPETMIKILGRWSSMAYQQYIRLSTTAAAAVSLQRRKPKYPAQQAAHRARFWKLCGSAAMGALIRFIMATVLGNQFLAGPFPFTRLMPLIKRLTYGVWNDGAVHVGSASRRKSLRPAKYASMVEAASP